MEAELVVRIKYSFIAINLFYVIHKRRLESGTYGLPSFLLERSKRVGWPSDTGISDSPESYARSVVNSRRQKLVPQLG